MRVIELLREHIRKIAEERGWLGEPVRVASSVKVRPLSPVEAIGRPDREDYPLLKGKEVMIEASFRGCRGQAFTDQPGDFEGSVADLLGLELETNFQRAVFVAASNAIMRHLGEIKGTVHCRYRGPAMCAQELPRWIRRNFPSARRVGLVGLQPGMLESLSLAFGPGNVKVVDLNPENIGTVKSGVEIWDGERETERVFRESDLVLVSGSTAVNGTLDGILEMAGRYDRPVVIYGVTGAGAAELLKLRRFCPFSE